MKNSPFTYIYLYFIADDGVGWGIKEDGSEAENLIPERHIVDENDCQKYCIDAKRKMIEVNSLWWNAHQDTCRCQIRTAKRKESGDDNFKFFWIRKTVY